MAPPSQRKRAQQGLYLAERQRHVQQALAATNYPNDRRAYTNSALQGGRGDLIKVDKYGRYVIRLDDSMTSEQKKSFGQDKDIYAVAKWNTKKGKWEPETYRFPDRPQTEAFMISEGTWNTRTDAVMEFKGDSEGRNQKPNLVLRPGKADFQPALNINSVRGGRDYRLSIDDNREGYGKTAKFAPMTFNGVGVNAPLDFKGMPINPNNPINGIGGQGKYYTDIAGEHTVPNDETYNNNAMADAWVNGAKPYTAGEKAKSFFVGVFRTATDPIGSVIDLYNGNYLEHNVEYTGKEAGIGVALTVGCIVGMEIVQGGRGAARAIQAGTTAGEVELGEGVVADAAESAATTSSRPLAGFSAEAGAGRGAGAGATNAEGNFFLEPVNPSGIAGQDLELMQFGKTHNTLTTIDKFATVMSSSENNSFFDAVRTISPRDLELEGMPRLHDKATMVQVWKRMGGTFTEEEQAILSANDARIDDIIANKPHEAQFYQDPEIPLTDEQIAKVQRMPASQRTELMDDYHFLVDSTLERPGSSFPSFDNLLSRAVVTEAEEMTVESGAANIAVDAAESGIPENVGGDTFYETTTNTYIDDIEEEFFDAVDDTIPTESTAEPTAAEPFDEEAWMEKFKEIMNRKVGEEGETFGEYIAATEPPTMTGAGDFWDAAVIEGEQTLGEETVMADTSTWARWDTLGKTRQAWRGFQRAFMETIDRTRVSPEQYQRIRLFVARVSGICFTRLNYGVKAVFVSLNAALAAGVGYELYRKQFEDYEMRLQNETITKAGILQKENDTDDANVPDDGGIVGEVYEPTLIVEEGVDAFGNQYERPQTQNFEIENTEQYVGQVFIFSETEMNMRDYIFVY